MAQETHDYWTATKHPWSCVLFVLPFLACYELGLLYAAPEELRNGADVWLRSALATVGLSPAYGAPCLLLAVLLLWSLLRRRDRPFDQAGVWVGMAVESALFALMLFALSQVLGQVVLRTDHLLGRVAQPLTVASPARPVDPALQQIISYLGAGVYEETLFRLLLYSGLLGIFTAAEFPPRLGIALAAAGSALLFAAAHHLGPQGDPFQGHVFAFRTVAGLFFAWLFHVRGFGITVGTHAGYDVLVGLLLR